MTHEFEIEPGLETEYPTVDSPPPPSPFLPLSLCLSLVLFVLLLHPYHPRLIGGRWLIICPPRQLADLVPSALQVAARSTQTVEEACSAALLRVRWP